MVAFTIPYLLYAPYANLQSKAGFIFGSFAVCSIVFTYLFVPEVAGRTLEEIEALFGMGIPTRAFRTTEVPLQEAIKGEAVHIEISDKSVNEVVDDAAHRV